MRTHDIMQTGAAGLESTTNFGIIIARNQAHKLGHTVAVEVRWTERIFSHEPPWWEDHEIRNGSARYSARASQDGEDRRIRVIKGDGADGIKATQVVLERVVISMPRHNVERCVVLRGNEKRVVELADNAVFLWLRLIVEACNRALEVARIGQTVGANRSELRKLEMALIKLANVPSNGARGEGDSIPANWSVFRCAEPQTLAQWERAYT